MAPRWSKKWNAAGMVLERGGVACLKQNEPEP